MPFNGCLGKFVGQRRGVIGFALLKLPTAKAGGFRAGLCGIPITPFVGRSDPGNERVDCGVYVAIMKRSTRCTRPLPH